jgi:hypothetical protein
MQVKLRYDEPLSRLTAEIHLATGTAKEHIDNFHIGAFLNRFWDAKPVFSLNNPPGYLHVHGEMPVEWRQQYAQIREDIFEACEAVLSDVLRNIVVDFNSRYIGDEKQLGNTENRL